MVGPGGLPPLSPNADADRHAERQRLDRFDLNGYHPAMSLYTRGGDDGTTGLPGGRRVAKHDPLVEACGTVDELNCTIGLARSVCPHVDVDRLLGELQAGLFELGADLAAGADPTSPAAAPRIDPRHGAALERRIEDFWSRLPALSNFILPGGCELAARLHHARAVCRRAERRCLAISDDPARALNPAIMVYLNRLGDLLFAVARFANQLECVPDTPWTPQQSHRPDATGP